MKKELLYVVLIGIITILLLEILLRFFQFEPGQIHKNKWVKKVDDLIVYNTFIADSNGIFKVNTEVLDSVSKYTNNEVGILYFNHSNIPCNNYASLIDKVKDKKVKSEFDKALLEYNVNPINNDGFYSIPFKKFQNESNKKVLLLGDSYTWGHTTINKTNSFANELLAKGYIVYNTGISAVDVLQYEAIAEKYISKLEPDIVILNFFMGNDIEYFKRDLKAFHPIYYGTNAGNIMAFQNGIEYYSALEAYDNIINQIFLNPKSYGQKIIIKSSVLTQLWKFFHEFGLISDNNEALIGEVLEKPACNEQIDNIISICKKNNVDFKLVVIPDYLYGKINVEDFPYLFENIDYNKSSIPEKYYNMNDGHFNDEGHKEFADFLDSLIKL